MTHRMTRLLLILGLTIAGIAGFLLFNKHSPLSYYTANPKSYEQCKKALGTLVNDRGIYSCTFRDKFFVDHKEKPSDNKTKTFTDSEFGYSLQYPGDIFSETDTRPTFGFLENKPFDSTTLVHSIDVQHCSLSGLPEHCTPQTTDLSITFTPLNKPYSEVIAAAEKGSLGNLADIDFGGIKAKTFEQGAEGEGLHYYIMELSNNRTLVVTRTYISEEILSSYQNAKDFIKFAEQKRIFEEVIKTLKIN